MPEATSPEPISAEAASVESAPAEPGPAENDESFGDLLSQFERSHSRPADQGSRQVEGTVIAVAAEQVFVDIGFKIEGVLPRSVFAAGDDGVKAGDRLLVSVKGRNEEGYYDLSRLKIAQPKDWSSLEEAFAAKATIAGTVTRRRQGRFDCGRRSPGLHARFAQWSAGCR